VPDGRKIIAVVVAPGPPGYATSVSAGLTRKACASSALVVACALSVPRVATATHTVKFRGQFVTIPGFPRSGNLFGEGADVRAEYTLSNLQTSGFPGSVEGIDLYLPSGTKLHAAGCPTCATSVLERIGPSACKKSAEAGPIGDAQADAPAAGEDGETETLQTFHAPGGGIELFGDGRGPITLEFLAPGSFVNTSSAAGYGPELVAHPLVEVGRFYNIMLSLDFEFGGAYRSAGKPTYYVTVPSSCKPPGLRFKADVVFNIGGEPPQSETVTATSVAPCPRHKRPNGSPKSR
jgi:hypothetical protein